MKRRTVTRLLLALPATLLAGCAGMLPGGDSADTNPDVYVGNDGFEEKRYELSLTKGQELTILEDTRTLPADGDFVYENPITSPGEYMIEVTVDGSMRDEFIWEEVAEPGSVEGDTDGVVVSMQEDRVVISYLSSEVPAENG